jgi:hypothetical protein
MSFFIVPSQWVYSSYPCKHSWVHFGNSCLKSLELHLVAYPRRLRAGSFRLAFWLFCSLKARDIKLWMFFVCLYIINNNNEGAHFAGPSADHILNKWINVNSHWGGEIVPYLLTIQPQASLLSISFIYSGHVPWLMWKFSRGFWNPLVFSLFNQRKTNYTLLRFLDITKLYIHIFKM